MCGIVGYISNSEVKSDLITGLKKLEYRGYDSVGIALFDANQNIKVLKNSGQIKDFISKYKNDTSDGHLGIGHTRWATHGVPSDNNSHPIFDQNETIALVHNGIIENYLDIKKELIDEGFKFKTDTDTECISNLISYYKNKDKDTLRSIKLTFQKIKGHAVVAIISKEDPGKIFGFKKGLAGSLRIGLSSNKISIASDLETIKSTSEKYISIENEEIFVATLKNILVISKDKKIEKEWISINEKSETISKNNFDFFIEKEIHEQPEVFLSNFQNRVNFSSKEVDFSNELRGLNLDEIKRINLFGMGTSYYACLLASYWLEQISKIPTQSNNASEFTYRNPLIEENTLAISVSQSGETADTLSAANLIKEMKIPQIAITNTNNSELEKITKNCINIGAKTEIGVASTKTFTATVEIFLLFAMYLGQTRNPGYPKTKIFEELKSIPSQIERILDNTKHIAGLAKLYSKYNNFLFLGRGYNYSIAMEAALKLKELSYVHAEGYPAGEMKHGPISLIDSKMPVFCIITQGSHMDKMISNIREVKSRNGKVIVLTNCSEKLDKSWYDDIIIFEKTEDLLSPFLSSVSIQIFAINLALARNLDIDKPRNLAKSVTVE